MLPHLGAKMEEAAVANAPGSWSTIWMLAFWVVLIFYLHERSERENAEKAVSRLSWYMTPAQLRRAQEDWEAEQEIRAEHEYE